MYLGWGQSGLNCWGVRGPALMFLFYVCIWNGPMVSLVLPGFDFTGSLGSPRQVVYLSGSMVLPWMTTSLSLSGNREAVVSLWLYMNIPGIRSWSSLSSKPLTI